MGGRVGIRVLRTQMAIFAEGEFHPFAHQRFRLRDEVGGVFPHDRGAAAGQDDEDVHAGVFGEAGHLAVGADALGAEDPAVAAEVELQGVRPGAAPRFIQAERI